MVATIEELAVRSSRREVSSNTQQQLLMEDIMWGNGVSVDDFSVDDLLDLSNEEQFDDFFKGVEEEDEEESKGRSVSVSSQGRHEDGSSNTSVGTFGTLPSVPVDEWKDLEWLSQFVDDSATQFPLFGKENLPTASEKCSYRGAVPTKARKKRCRTSTKAWSFAWISKVLCPEKNPTKKRLTAASVGGCEAQTQRRCCHCHVQKTPQWRSGPLGAKTLCNACGVRFKSGRLVPEYRPACSPMFSEDVHSNSHRKVLEIRRKKESATADVMVASAGV